MSTILRGIICLTVVTAFTSCSLMQRWGVLRPTLQLHSVERTELNGQQFETRRYVITESNPAETVLETRQITR